MSEIKETFEEIKNTKLIVILKGNLGSYIVWSFEYDSTNSKYYADQYSNGSLIKHQLLSRDKTEAQRLFDRVIRHKRGFGKKKERE